jgi:hypothetical protein
MIISFTSWVISVSIGCRHPLIRYWQSSLTNTTEACNLLHPENEYQRRVNSVCSGIFGNQGIVQLFALITELLTALMGNNTIYQWSNTDSKLIDIANGKACHNALLVNENTIVI